MNRRHFMFGVGGGIASIGMFDLGKDIYASEPQPEIKTDKAVIFLFLGGGASIADSFAPKPDSLPEFRPVNGVVQTKSGYLFGADFKNLAEHSDSITTVHNFKTFDGNHSSATAYVYSGHPAFGLAEGAPSKNPSYGSILSYTHGERNSINGLPNYIKVDKNLHDGAGWLGSKYVGFANDEDGIKNLQLNGVSPESFVRRNQMVNEIEKLSGRTDHFFKEYSNLRNSAKEIVMGQAAQAFNLKNEPEVWRTKYNSDRGGFGRNCLLARRLVEAGAKFITLQHGGWDAHDNISRSMSERGGELDLYLSILIDDLKSKHLLEKTLIIVTSEFSRTKLNKGGQTGIAGRDHNPLICPLLLIGGNYGGTIIGTSSKDAIMAEGVPFTPEDLSYTILHYMGVSSSYTIVDNMSRPRHLVEGNARLIV